MQVVRRNVIGMIGAGVIALGGLTGSVAAQSDAQPTQDTLIRQELSLTRYTLAEFTLPGGAGDERVDFAVRVRLDGLERTLIMSPHSVRAPGFETFIADATGALTPFEPPEETTFRGTVVGEHDSVVGGSLKNGKLTAMVLMPQDPNPRWMIQPLSDIIPGAPETIHVVYCEADTVPGNWFCPVDEQFGVAAPANHDPAHGSGVPESGPLICEIACDTDFEYFQLNSSNPEKTVTDINEIIDLSSIIYERECQVQFAITTVIVRITEPDPYTSDDPYVMLDEFGAEWNSNQRGVNRDIAHFFTGKNIAGASGGIIGLAWLSVICSPDRGYGLSQSRFSGNMSYRVALTTHELGHNFSSFHCNQPMGQCDPCGIMCSSVAGCGGGQVSLFGCSADVIARYASGAPCMGTSSAVPTWIKQFGTSTGDEPNDLALDGDNLLIAGFTYSSLGGQNQGGADAFVAKHDSSGNQTSVFQFGTTKGDFATSVASDTRGGVYVAGYTLGEFPGVPNNGIADGFLARYDGQNQEIWALQFGSWWHDEVDAIVPDGGGGVLMTGYTNGDFWAFNQGASDIFVARVASDGSLVWGIQFGTAGSEEALAIASDGDGGAIVAGRTTGDLGDPNVGGTDVFVTRFDKDGSQLWMHQFGTPAGDEALAIASDGKGGSLIAGSTTGSLAGSNGGDSDAFYARYDADGNQLELRQFGTSINDVAYAVTPDANGGAVVAGLTRGSLGGPSKGLSDAFVVVYDKNGEQGALSQFGTDKNDAAISLATDRLGGVYVAGRTDGKLGTGVAGATDVFLAYLEGFAGSCYADCDQSTGVNVLDVFDFLCFQNSFVNSEPFACECDTSTGPEICDVFDFLCFQDAFVGGCQ